MSKHEPDHTVTGIINDHLARKACLPTEHFVDQGYTSVDHLVQADKEYNLHLIGAVPDDNSWQALHQGYDICPFTIDWDKESAGCPQNHTSCSWSLAQTRSQRPVVKIKFRRKDCGAGPQLDLCTNNKEKKKDADRFGTASTL